MNRLDKIVTLRYEEFLTLQEVADFIGISKQRVDRILKDAGYTTGPENRGFKRFLLDNPEVTDLSFWDYCSKKVKHQDYSIDYFISCAAREFNIKISYHRMCQLFRHLDIYELYISPPEKERLLRFLDIPENKSRCWLWQGYTHINGYGWCSNGKGESEWAHRVVYRAFVGEIPDDKQVLHICSNPACSNPAHLYLGTPSENMADREAAGHTYQVNKASSKPVRAINLDTGEIREFGSFNKCHQALDVQQSAISNWFAGKYGAHVKGWVFELIVEESCCIEKVAA